jgi:uncharacterized small protein (TIGR04563 family)
MPVKQSLYFDAEMAKEVNVEAIRLDRSLSWIIQQTWRIARTTVMTLPEKPRQSAPSVASKPLGPPLPPEMRSTPDDVPLDWDVWTPKE